MSVTKTISIINSGGYPEKSSNIGAEAQYVDIARNSNGKIITDITSETPSTRESVAQTIKNIEETKKNVIDSPSQGNIGGVIENATRTINNYEISPGQFITIIPNIASGDFTHAEGISYTKIVNEVPKVYQTVAKGLASHAEGSGTTANSIVSHAEGYETLANSYYSHAEGSYTIADGVSCHVEGSETLAYNNYSHAEGCRTTANGQNSHVEGFRTLAGDENSHAEGTGTTASGKASHAEGGQTSAIGTASHAEGGQTSAIGSTSHAEGIYTLAGGNSSHAEGCGTIAEGGYSHAEGEDTIAKGIASHVSGKSTIANDLQTVVGKYNREITASSTTAGGYFIVGSGSGVSHRANAFRVTDGGCYGIGAWNASGADYAEMFEWLDKNSNNEDRIGKFVTLDGDKIKLATSQDNYILGIVSGNPTVVGDVCDDQWQGMFERDIYGRFIYEQSENETKVLKVNPTYDNTQLYIGRSERPEWDAVGLIGKLVCIDDGTSVVNGYVKVTDESIATKSNEKTRFRVLKRLDENHIQIMIL